MLPQRTLHATVPVSDLDRAREFYEGRLGFEAFDENEDGVYYRAAEGSILALYPSSFAGANPGTAAAFLVPDVEAEVEELRAKGIVFEDYDLPELRTEKGIATLGFFRAAWFKDPDGNVLGIFQKT